MRVTDTERNNRICELYASRKYTTENIARKFGIQRRRVQQIAKRAGIVRTQAEGNRVATPFKTKHRIMTHRVKIPKPGQKRIQLSKKLRYMVLAGHPWCNNCGLRPSDGIRLEVDHIDGDPLNNDARNLQPLCPDCNKGKYHAQRRHFIDSGV